MSAASSVPASTPPPAVPPPWLVLIHQLPPKPDYVRVKVRRRLHQLGAIALKNTVYVLPRTEDALEDFQWLRREIVELGGDATVLEAGLVEGLRREELEQQFEKERSDEYRAIAESAGGVEVPTEADIDRLRRHLQEVVRRDHFGAAARSVAEEALRALEARHRGGPGDGPARAGQRALGTPGGVWVTRQGVKVDRIASAWLIRRFIDPDARFKFVAPTGYDPAPGECRFDMFEGEYTHEGDRCTFETLVRRFGLDDAALAAVGEVVHDIDCKDGKFGRPAVPGIAAAIDGIVLSHDTDPARLEVGASVFEGLWAQFRGG